MAAKSWTAGTTHTIAWTASDNVGVTAIDLSYSIDGGANFTAIGHGYRQHRDIRLERAQSAHDQRDRESPSLTMPRATPAPMCRTPPSPSWRPIRSADREP